MIAVAEVVVPVPLWDRNEDWDTERTYSGWCQWDTTEVTKDAVLNSVLSQLSNDGMIPYQVTADQCRVSRWRVVTWDDDWDDLVAYWGSSFCRIGASLLYEAWKHGELHVVDKLECWG